jgi:hypothetical protein
MRRLLAVASLAVAFAGIAAIAGPTPARACSCATPFVRPADGATGVPLNTRIWVPSLGLDAKGVRLLREGGEEIPCDLGAIHHTAGMTVLVLTPRTPLAPSSRYQVRAPFAAYNPQPTSFTTGDTTDSTAPASPMAKLSRVCAALTPNSSCGPHYRLLEFEVPSDDTPLVVLTTGEEPPLPTLDRLPASWPPAGPRPMLSDRWSQQTPPTLSLGQGTCSRWPLDQPRGNIFFGAVDLAGNFSGWRAGGPVALPDYPTVAVPDPAQQCVDPSMANMGGGPPPVDSGPPPDGATASSAASGCGIAGRGLPGSGSAALLLAALLLIVGARRRPRDHARSASPAPPGSARPVTGTSPGRRPAAPGR